MYTHDEDRGRGRSAWMYTHDEDRAVVGARGCTHMIKTGPL